MPPIPKIGLNKELLFRKGTILICPSCHLEHYQVMRDIYKKDHIIASQVEPMNNEILSTALMVDQRCQKCRGGGIVPLAEKLAGRVYERR